MILILLLPLCVYVMGLGRMEWREPEFLESLYSILYLIALLFCRPALVRSGCCNERLLSRYLTQHTFISSPLWRLKLVIKGLANCILFQKSISSVCNFDLGLFMVLCICCLVFYLMLCFVSLHLMKGTSLLGLFGTMTSQVCCCHHLAFDSS